MGENPLKNHTTRLTDGDYILSPSLTNLYSGLHGNGILLLEDAATGDTDRDSAADLGGAITASNNVLTIKPGYAVIDGMVVRFGADAHSNSFSNYTLTLQDSTVNFGSTNTDHLSTAGDTCLLVVYVCSNKSGTPNNKNIQVEAGTKVNGSYPLTPEAFLTDPNSSFDSKQSTVLAVLKAEYNSSHGDMNLNITNVYDCRTFIRRDPIYFSPMTKDAVGTYTNNVKTHTTLDGMHGAGNENGALDGSPFGALWMTKNTSDEAVLMFSGEQASSRRTWRLGPDKMQFYDGSGPTVTFTFDGTNIWNVEPAAAININPSGDFPISHVVSVYNSDDTHAVTFDSAGIAVTVGALSSAMFTFDGTNWKQVFAGAQVAGTASGAQGLIQFRGTQSGVHSSDAGFKFDKGEATGVLINNGSGYAGGTTTALAVDTVDATTKIAVGDVLRRNTAGGDIIGTVTAVASTSVTFAAGTLNAVSNNDNLYRDSDMTLTGNASISGNILNPKGMEMVPIAKNPYSANAGNTLWMNSTQSNRLYQGANKILNDSDTVGVSTLIELTDLPINYSGGEDKFLYVDTSTQATGVIVANGGGSGYNAGTTGAMTFSTVAPNTVIAVGDQLRKTNSSGAIVGTVTAVNATTITIGAGTGVSLSNGDTLYRDNKVRFVSILSSHLESNLNTITHIGPAGILTVNQDLTVTGNLTVSGANTVLNVSDIEVEDKHILLGKVGSPTDSTADGGGLILQGDDTTYPQKTILWDNNTDAWRFNQHILPSADSTFNLGSSAVRFANAYFDTFNTTTATFTGDVTFDTNTLKVDAANNRVGILQATPEATFQIDGVGRGYKQVAGTGNNSSTGTPIYAPLFDMKKFRGGSALVEVVNATDNSSEVFRVTFTHNGTASSAASAFTYDVVDVGIKTHGNTACTIAVAASETDGTTDAGDYGAGLTQLAIKMTPGQNSQNYTTKVSWEAIAI